MQLRISSSLQEILAARSACQEYDAALRIFKAQAWVQHHRLHKAARG